MSTFGISSTACIIADIGRLINNIQLTHDVDDKILRKKLLHASNLLDRTLIGILDGRKVKVPVSRKKVAKKSKKGGEKWGKVLESVDEWYRKNPAKEDRERLAQRIAL
jgi:hypothetical protein